MRTNPLAAKVFLSTLSGVPTPILPPTINKVCAPIFPKKELVLFPLDLTHFLYNYQISFWLKSYCQTRLHLGFSAKLGVWQDSAFKMEPRSGIII